ncbi:MAG: histidine kinase [Chitinophagaceae bacterium]
MAVCWLSDLSAKAQYDEKNFIRYSVENGLSNNYVTCIQQDDWGHIWVGTDEGLNRFDGNSFSNYFQGSKSLPLSSNIVVNIKKLGHHELGIIANGVFQVLNTQNLSTRNYFVPDSTPFAKHRNLAFDAVKLPDGGFAVTTRIGFHVFDKNGNVKLQHDEYTLEDVGKKRLHYGRNILPLSNKEYLIFVEENGLAYYHYDENRFHRISPDDKAPYIFYPLSPKNNRSYVLDYKIAEHEFLFFDFNSNMVYYNHLTKKTVATYIPDGNTTLYWASKFLMVNDTTILVNGAVSGFYKFYLNRYTGEIKWNGIVYLPNQKVQCLFLDKAERLWIGTSKGLLQQKPDAQALQSYPILPSAGIGGKYSAVYRVKDKMYVGRYLWTGGLVIADVNTMKAEKEIKFFSDNNMWNEVRSIQMYHPDTLWIATTAGLLWFDIKTQRYGKLETHFDQRGNNLINLYPENKDGYAWMCGSLNGTVARYHVASRAFTFFTKFTTPKLPFNQIKSIAYDAYGDVWIGGHSLARWSSGKENFDTLITVYGGVNKYNDDIVALTADDNGSLWLHNVENGLLEYRIQKGQFISYARHNGMPFEVLESISPVLNDILWISSSSNLIRFDTRTKKIFLFDHNDGFPDEATKNRKMYYDSLSKSMYLPFSGSVVSFDPLLQLKSSAAKDILITEHRINNNKSIYYPADNLSFPYNENNHSLYFTIIDYDNNNYQYDYRINETGNWTGLDKQRSLNLTSLSPGTYKVHLRAIGKSGDEKLKTFSFTIMPPFWNTVWFYVIAGILLLSVGYLFYLARIKSIRERANVDKLLAQTELKALHAQMNPHFISNSLNSIREMILNDENKQASHFLTKFAHLIRITLDQSSQTFISLRNTIDYLNRYIEMEQIRNDQFVSNIYVDKELNEDEILLPPMLIQPFIENSIWHGLDGEDKSIAVAIHFKKQDEKLVCIIDDNGIGIKQSLEMKKMGNGQHSSVAVFNIKQRINLLNEKYDLRSSVTIEDKMSFTEFPEKGTRVILNLPLELNHLADN